MLLVRKSDEDRQIVYGEVYAPNVLDTHGSMMTEDDIEVMAHRFMSLYLAEAIDTKHSNVPVGARPVESFIARKGDPDFQQGAWVLGVHITDASVWEQVKKGELNAFSFDAFVDKTNAVVELEVDPTAIGVTEENEGHTHLFFANVNDDGKIVSGRTSTTLGHAHEIKGGSATEETNGHTHRFFV